MSASEGRWISRLKDARDERVRILCIHHAGAAASFFRPWTITLPPHASLWVAQLPGREERRNEPFETSMPVVLDHLLAELDGFTEGPYVIFGHSLGGCIAYELALRIQATQQRRPLVLGISATRAPASPMGAPTYNLPDDAFLAGIQGFGGTPKAVVADRELLMWALPRLRADTELNERAPLTRDGCLDINIVCFHGTEDPVCDRRECEKWSAHTTGGFEAHGFQGGHFYLRDHQRAIIEVLLRDRSVASVHPPRAADGSR